METIEDYIKQKKLDELDSNYQAAAEWLTVGSKTYHVTTETIADVTGLATLGVGSDLAVTENDVLQLVNHSAQEITDLLEAIRAHLTPLRVTRFNKREALKALTDHDQIQNFDVSI